VECCWPGQSCTAVKELIPTGKLRVGVVFAPAPSAFFVVKEANGEPRGVTVDLAVELGRKLGVPVDFMVAPNSGLVTDATESGAIDVAFMPVDEERKKRVDFGPSYFVIESTYLATGASGIRTVAEVDRPNVRIVGIANTTTIRAAGRSLKNTSISAAASVDEAMAMLRSGKADAFALSRDSLPPFVAQLPRFANRRWRLSADRHCDRNPEASAECARICHSLYGERQGLRECTARAGQGRISERAGSAVMSTIDCCWMHGGR
jgi:polar amino acid transport system substrate-binding protein